MGSTKTIVREKIVSNISNSLGQLPPQAVDLEESVLGAIILEKSSQKSALKMLHPDHFYTEPHKEIFKAILDLHNASDPIDMKSVVIQLKKTGKLELIGGAYYIATLTAKVSQGTNVDYYIRVLIELSIKRTMIQISSESHKESYDDTSDAFEILDKSIDQLRKLQSFRTQSYIPVDMVKSVAEHGERIQEGESCRIDAMGDVFAWMRGFVNGWYGWANDGKGTFLDFVMTLKSKRDSWKWCLYKQEDMDTVIIDGKAQIKANRIYKNLAWSYSGKTWNAGFAEKRHVRAMELDEEVEALEFIMKHFFVIYPKDRRFKTLMDEFKYMYETFGVDGFLIDPWNTVLLADNKRGDERLVDAFIDIKEFAMETNTVFNIVNHPRSMTDVKEKDGRYKIVNQFMQLGGSAWDMKMDGQYSIYRPERHLNPADPRVHFYNLKQRQAEIVGVERGSYELIKFDKIKRQYTFNGINPMDGSDENAKFTQGNMFTNEKEEPTDDLPF